VKEGREKKEGEREEQRKEGRDGGKKKVSEKRKK
jgi:hypothetical protein